MKRWKTAGKIAVTACYAVGLFHCMIYGAPQEKIIKVPYMILAGITCIFIPVSFCACRYQKMVLCRENQELQRKIDSLRKNAAKLDK